MRIFYTTILSRYKFYHKSHVNLKAWFFFDSFLARSSHSSYPRGKFELEYEDSIGDSGGKKYMKANELI